MAMLAPLAMPLMLAGGAVSAYGSIAKGNAEASAYNYKAGVAQVNTRIAEQNRDYAYAAGGREAARYGANAAQRMGKIITGQGASGLDVNSGSAVDVRASQRTADIADQKTIQENAGRRAYGFSVQAENFRAEESMNRSAASNAKSAGVLGAVSSLIGSATSVAGKWYQGTQTGLYGGSTDPWRGLREDDISSNHYSMS